MKIISRSAAYWWDYFILTARVLLAFIFLGYGAAKLLGYQFGVAADVLRQPLGQVSLAHVAWYCFAQQPFSAFIGVSQVVASLLLLWNRTALLGALMLLPIAVVIFIIDITFLGDIVAFRYALPFYLGLLLLIFAHYRDRMRRVWQALAVQVTTRFSYPWWAYASLPLAAGLLSLGWLLPKYLVDFIHNPTGTLRYLHLLWTNAKHLLHL